jgi:electron transport complex protein RnfC
MKTSDTMTPCSINLFDFHGGIHPAEHKTESNQQPIRQLPLPPKLILPLKQHIGAASKVLVSVGQQVLKGEKLAEADGFFSVALHAPTSGVVESIGDHPIAHPSGQSDRCIVLIPDGQDTWCPLQGCEQPMALNADDIREKVHEAGIAGMGGAGFPASIKLSPPPSSHIETLILNAAECEPYITADDRLLQERADEVLEGLLLVEKVVGARQCLIGIEDNKPEAIAALRSALAARSDVREHAVQLCVIPTKYPSGGEKQLIRILTGKEVPSSGLPADIGIVCHNVGTVLAVYRAVRFGEPLISRITTLTGEQIQQKGNVEVLLGTPIDWLMSQCGYQAAKPERLIHGGPMMGFTLVHYDVPVVKTTNCILAPSTSELPLPPPAQACIRCGLCADVCPAELLPQQLYWFSRAEEYEKAEHHNLFDCIECGACSYVCPSSIPLVQYYRHAKGEIKQIKENQRKSDQARERFEARQRRLEAEQAEKAAKRKERAEAAAKAQAAKLAQAEQASVAGVPEVAPEVAKKAVVSEALQRVQAKQEQAAEEVDVDALKSAWEKAQAKLDKMYDTLEDAKVTMPDQVDKLTRAVEKNQMRVNQAKLAWQNAEKVALQAAAASAKSEEVPEAALPDIDALTDALQKAEAKLILMQETLAGAAPEQQEKLSRAVDKNKVRVEAARAALEAAKKQVQQANSEDNSEGGSK